jgi:hypothetical protein
MTDGEKTSGGGKVRHGERFLTAPNSNLTPVWTYASRIHETIRSLYHSTEAALFAFREYRHIATSGCKVQGTPHPVTLRLRHARQGLSVLPPFIGVGIGIGIDWSTMMQVGKDSIPIPIATPTPKYSDRFPRIERSWPARLKGLRILSILYILSKPPALLFRTVPRSKAVPILLLPNPAKQAT